MTNKKNSARGGKTKTKAKLYLALGSVAVLTIIVGYALLAQKRVNVELLESQAATSSKTKPTAAAVASIFKGSGCYTTGETNIGDAFVNSSVFDWYIVKGENMDKAAVKKLNRPIAMAQKNKTADELKALIDKYSSRIKAVIWDYEVAGTSQSKAESDLTAIYNYAHSKGLLFGVVTFSNVQTSKNYGVDYGRAKNFADFLMPMIYCQWPALGKGCGDPNNKVKSLWADDNNATSVPLVPLAAIQTTGNDVQGVTVTPQQIIDNYGYLQPKPMTIGYWNPVLNQDLVNAIAKVESGTLNPQDLSAMKDMQGIVSPTQSCLTSKLPNVRLSRPKDKLGSICMQGTPQTPASGFPVWPDITKYGWSFAMGGINTDTNSGSNWCPLGYSKDTHPTGKDYEANYGQPNPNGQTIGGDTTGRFCILFSKINSDSKKWIWCTENGCKKEGF